MEHNVENTAYANGIVSATKQIMKFVEKEIKKIVDSNTEPNTPRQITNGGKLQAYNKVLQKLQDKKRHTIKKYLVK